MMRQLIAVEVEMQAETIASQRDFFIKFNTSPMAEHEQVNGECIPVHRIRYTGATGSKNVFAL